MSTTTTKTDQSDHQPDLPEIAATITLRLLPLDVQILILMQQAGRFVSLEHLIAQAIYHYAARHLQIGDVPLTFMSTQIRHERDAVRRERATLAQWRTGSEE